LSEEPLISLALPIKNGLPGLKRVIEALRKQTYKNFELLVQDGGSTDGSLEYLRAADLPRMEILTQTDTGHGQAYNRVWARCRGPICCMLACDEYLESNALQLYVKWYKEHSGAAYCYGYSRLWKDESEVHSISRAGPFNFLKLLLSEYSPPAGAGFYNRKVIGSDFYYDENLKTCPDFDFFIRLGLRFGPLQIVEKNDIVFNSIRNQSMTTFRPQSFDQIAQDKIFIIDRFFVSQGNSRFNQFLRSQAYAGMYCWLASLLYEIVGETEQFCKYVMEAGKHAPGSDRVAKLVAQSRSLAIDNASGQVLTRRQVQPAHPPRGAAKLVLNLAEAHSDTSWGNAQATPSGSRLRVVTDEAPWSYAAALPLRVASEFVHEAWYWLEVGVDVHAGQVGIGVLGSEHELKWERLVSAEDRRTRVVIVVTPAEVSLIVRNGSLGGPSVVDLLDAHIWAMEIPSSDY